MTARLNNAISISKFHAAVHLRHWSLDHWPLPKMAPSRRTPPTRPLFPLSQRRNPQRAGQTQCLGTSRSGGCCAIGQRRDATVADSCHGYNRQVPVACKRHQEVGPPPKKTRNSRAGTQIRTGRKSKLVLRVGLNATLLIDSLARVTLPTVKQDGDTLTTTVQVDRGRTDIKVGHVGLTNDFSVLTPSGALAVKGTEFAVSHNALQRHSNCVRSHQHHSCH